MPMTEEDIQILGSALMGQLMSLGIQRKVIIASMAGIDTSEVPSVQYNVPVNAALTQAFGKLSTERKRKALPILADQLMATNGDAGRDELTRLLHHHGYEYINGTFVPVGLIDEREKQYVPQPSAIELAKAFTRLVQGDESGAITSACEAVEAATNALYAKHSLGDTKASYQAKVNTVLHRLKIIDKLKKELTELPISNKDAEKIAEEVHEATKHAAEALQAIRRSLGDVHGTKPTKTRIVYDSIKWASAICGLLEGE